MKTINRQIVFTVLSVHIAILLLVWGGLSALGVAFILSFPLIGGTSWIAYQIGRESRVNTKRTKEISLSTFQPFRG